MTRHNARRTSPPPVHFDGQLHWFTSCFDPTDDRCSRCQGPIAEDEVPLVLFKEVGRALWEARICERCTPLIARLFKESPSKS
jgi:hypothetical protein